MASGLKLPFKLPGMKRWEQIAPFDDVAAADPYSFQVAHRRLAWMLRQSVAINIVLGVCLVASLAAWSELVPLRKVEIALLRAEPGDNRLYRVEPITNQVGGFDLLMEQQARRYVRLLLEIDEVTQAERFAEAFRMTDATFYEKFKSERFKSIDKAISEGLTRSITVESVDRIDTVGKNYKYAVDFVQTDRRKGEEVERRKLRAYLNMTTRPNTVREADRFQNPLGITVLDLVLKERANQ
jgi:type IV secretion system protein VirB8